jgi:pimeloyl-ACP methyl ester carboxylesterase
MIPFVDFGGGGPRLHFAHANGFPPRTYAPLLETLARDHHVFAMLARPLWPGASPEAIESWEPFVDDLLQFLDERGETGVIGVGHSLGAVTTLAAALRRPELFRAVVAIEPPLLRRRILLPWYFLRKLGLAHVAHPLIAATLRRQRAFDGKDEMLARYRRASVFGRVDDRGLQAYVDALAMPRPDGRVALAYSAEWEAKVYESGPLDLWSQLHTLKPPSLFIRGLHSDAFLPKAAHKVQQALPNTVLHTLAEAGHLVPLEKPGQVARLITEFIQLHS